MAPPRKYKVIDGRYCCPDCNHTYKSEYSCSNHWRKMHKPTNQNNPDGNIDELHKQLGIAVMKVKQLEQSILLFNTS